MLWPEQPIDSVTSYITYNFVPSLFSWSHQPVSISRHGPTFFCTLFLTGILDLLSGCRGEKVCCPSLLTWQHLQCGQLLFSSYHLFGSPCRLFLCCCPLRTKGQPLLPSPQSYSWVSCTREPLTPVHMLLGCNGISVLLPPMGNC